MAALQQGTRGGAVAAAAKGLQDSDSENEWSGERRAGGRAAAVPLLVALPVCSRATWLVRYSLTATARCHPHLTQSRNSVALSSHATISAPRSLVTLALAFILCPLSLDGGGSVYEYGEEIEVSAEDEAALAAFLPPDADAYQQRTLADLVLERIREKQAEQGVSEIPRWVGLPARACS